jgi:hypothetical protein
MIYYSMFNLEQNGYLRNLGVKYETEIDTI